MDEESETPPPVVLTGIYLNALELDAAVSGIMGQMFDNMDARPATREAAREAIVSILHKNQSAARLERIRLVHGNISIFDKCIFDIDACIQDDALEKLRAIVECFKTQLIDGHGNGAARKVLESALALLHQRLPVWAPHSLPTFKKWLLQERMSLRNTFNSSLDRIATACAVFDGIGNVHSHANAPKELSVRETTLLLDHFKSVVLNFEAIVQDLLFRPIRRGSVTSSSSSSSTGSNRGQRFTSPEEQCDSWIKAMTNKLLEDRPAPGEPHLCIVTHTMTVHDCFDTANHSVEQIRVWYPSLRVLPCKYVETCAMHARQTKLACLFIHDLDWKRWIFAVLTIKRRFCIAQGECQYTTCFKSHSVAEIRLYDPGFMKYSCSKRYCRDSLQCRDDHGRYETRDETEIFHFPSRTSAAIAHFKARA